MAIDPITDIEDLDPDDDEIADEDAPPTTPDDQGVPPSDR
jgi:hypothetical protein